MSASGTNQMPAPDRDEARSAAGHAIAAGEELTPDAAKNDPMATILARHGVHRGKFRAAYAILADVFAIAVAAFVVLLLRGGPADPRPWSLFEPAVADIGAAKEIAAFVESRYLFEDGTPLVDVSADWLTLQGKQVEFVSIERPDINGRADQLLTPVSSSVRFGLCGEGLKCAITKGEASPERLRYLSRASVELAAYTFTYMPQVESVVAYLPPPEGTEPTWALYFERANFAAVLESPIDDVLTPTPPPNAAAMSAEEAAFVEGLSVPAQFRYEFWETEASETVLKLVAPGLE